MNGYQRILSALAGKPVDQRPVMLHNFMFVAEQAGITMREYRDNPNLAAEAHISFAEKYNTDGLLVDVDTTVLAGAVGVPVDYPENEPARICDSLISSLDEVEQLKPIKLEENERIQKWLEICKIVKNHFNDEKYIRGNCDQAPFSLATMIRGSSNLMMDLLIEPEKAFLLLDYCNDVSIQFIDLMATTGVHMVSNGDSPAGPDMISPDLYEKFALPYERELVQAAHKHNLHYTSHICGNTELILDKMISTGTDAIELDYKTPSEKIHKVCRNNVTVIGTIDPSGVLAQGTISDVEKEARILLNLFSDRSRFIMNAGCAIPPHTPPENIKKLIEVTHSFNG